MNTYLLWRLLKFLSLVLLAAGVFGAVFASRRSRRIQSMLLLTLGFTGVWFAGFALMKMTGRVLHDAWILWAIVASLVSYYGSAAAAHGYGTGRVHAFLASAGLLTAVAVMVSRSGDLMILGALTVLGCAIPLTFLHLLNRTVESRDEEDARASWNWFKWLARLEGVSLILMMLVSMPLKMAAGISLDAGTGLIGWLHGVLFVLYCMALFTTGRFLNWSIGRRAGGFALALVPFGTFFFEMKSRPGLASGDRQHGLRGEFSRGNRPL